MRKKSSLLLRALQIQSNQAATNLETNSLLDSTQSAEGAMQAAVGSGVGVGVGILWSTKPECPATMAWALWGSQLLHSGWTWGHSSTEASHPTLPGNSPSWSEYRAGTDKRSHGRLLLIGGRPTVSKALLHQSSAPQACPQANLVKVFSQLSSLIQNNSGLWQVDMKLASTQQAWGGHNTLFRVHPWPMSPFPFLPSWKWPLAHC